MYPPIEALIPQRGISIMLRGVLEHSALGTSCDANIGADLQYLSGGVVSSILALELIAQTVAVHVALVSNRGKSTQKSGYLIGVSTMKFQGGDFHLGDSVVMSVSPVFHDGPLGRYEGNVECAGLVRAYGVLTVYEPPATLL